MLLIFSKDQTHCYKLGTIAKLDNNYLLTTLTHFGQHNNAHLEIDEYFSFLANFGMKFTIL